MLRGACPAMVGGAPPRNRSSKRPPDGGPGAGSIGDGSLERDPEGAGWLTLTGGRGMGVFAPSRPRGNGYSPCSGAALLSARPCGRCHLCLGNPTGRNSEELYTLLPNPLRIGVSPSFHGGATSRLLAHSVLLRCALPPSLLALPFGQGTRRIIRVYTGSVSLYEWLRNGLPPPVCGFW